MRTGRIPSCFGGRRFITVRTGFSLLELLVVVAVIAILSALLLPGIGVAKAKAQTAACIRNLGQLSLAWRLYSDDNNGTLVVNIPAPKTGQSWVNADFLGAVRATNSMILQAGMLYPYVRSLAIYHCPADRTGSGGVLSVLSYSMNGWMGSRTMTQPGFQQFGLNYRTFMREAELSVIGAMSRLWLIADEDPSTLDDGWFLVTMNDAMPFGNFPGIRHHHGCGINFADGHADTFRLRDPGSVPGTPIRPSNLDWMLFKQMTTER